MAHHSWQPLFWQGGLQRRKQKAGLLRCSECSCIPALNIFFFPRAVACSRVSAHSVSFLVLSSFRMFFCDTHCLHYSSCQSCHAGTEDVAQLQSTGLACTDPKFIKRSIVVHPCSPSAQGGSRMIRSARSVSATVACVRPVWDTWDTQERESPGERDGWAGKVLAAKLAKPSSIPDLQCWRKTNSLMSIHTYAVWTEYAPLHSINTFLKTKLNFF